MGMKAHIKGHLHEFFCPFLPTGSYSKSGKYRTNRIKKGKKSRKKRDRRDKKNSRKKTYKSSSLEL